LKSLDQRKEKIWISLPFPWNFLPCDLEISSFGLENASAARLGQKAQCYKDRKARESPGARRF
jgi:hypothetical protein